MSMFANDAIPYHNHTLYETNKSIECNLDIKTHFDKESRPCHGNVNETFTIC